MLFRDILMTAAMGAGPLYSAEALALFARMTSQPDATRKALIDDLIGDLKAAGIWDACDAIHVFASHDSQAALLNWKGASYDGTAFNSPTFTADRGFTGNGSTTSIETGAVLNALTRYTQNSAHMAAWALEDDAAADRCIMGASNSLNAILTPRDAGGNFSARINDTSSIFVAAIPTAAGFSGANRTGASARQIYKNGAAVASDTRASVTPPANQMSYLRGNAFFSANQIAFGSFGGSLTDSQWSAYHTAVQLYLQGVGAI